MTDAPNSLAVATVVDRDDGSDCPDSTDSVDGDMAAMPSVDTFNAVGRVAYLDNFEFSFLRRSTGEGDITAADGYELFLCSLDCWAASTVLPSEDDCRVVTLGGTDVACDIGMGEVPVVGGGDARGLGAKMDDAGLDLDRLVTVGPVDDSLRSEIECEDVSGSRCCF